jgi:outer membrane receptor for ferrienterochelin and colicin
MPRVYAVLLFILIPLVSFGQTGSIKGTIKDSKTREPLIGATIVVTGTGLGASTGIEGEFSIAKVPVGKYSIAISSVSYTPITLDEINVEAGNAVVIHTTLNEMAYQLQGITFQATKLTSTDISMVSEIREAKLVVSAISGAQIAKTQDRDAAEVVRRIPGVTLMDNRFILVRGLNDRYNSVWLNDAASPSTEADKKSFSFDIIPTAVIDRILVYKNPSAELPGDFAGGMVKVYTKTSLPSNDWNISLSEGYRTGSTFQNLNYTTKSATDFLGFDDDSRKIPFNSRIGASLSDEQAAAGAFKNTWGIHKTTALPDLRLSITKGSNFHIAGRTVDAVSLLNYSNTNTVFTIQRKDSDPDVDLIDHQSTNQVRLGAMQNFGIRLNNKNKIEWRNLFNQIGTDQTTLREGRVLDPHEKSYLEYYQSRWILSSQLNGKHISTNDKSEYTWTLGYSHTNRNDPDLKRIGYFQSGAFPFSASVPPGSADTRYGGRFYQKLNENDYSFTHNYLHKMDVGKTRIDLNAGNYLEYRSRNFNARSLGYVLPPGSSPNDQALKELPVDSIFAPLNVGKGGFVMNEITDGSDSYRGENKLLATYISLGIPFTEKLKLIGGVRSEYNIQSLVSEVNLVRTSPRMERLNFLPSANLSYNFTKTSLVRITYGRSLNRPEFREWAPFKFYDFNFNVNVYGSLFPTPLSGGQPLKTALIDNIDIRYELYPTPNELFHIGVFYKNFTNPIEQYILPGSNRTYTFANAESAYVEGIEFDLRKNLGFLYGTFFNNLSLVANASLINSRIHITNSINQVENRPLQGQSNYVVNAGLYYQDDNSGITASITYNVFGPRIFLVGSKDYASWGELPRNTIDMAIIYPISKRVSLTFAAQDLLNQPVQLVQDVNQDGKFDRSGTRDLTIQKFRRGRYFNLGVRFTL